MSGRVYRDVVLPEGAREGDLVRIDADGRCGLVTADRRVLVYGTHGTVFVNYPYRLGPAEKTYGVFDA